MEEKKFNIMKLLNRIGLSFVVVILVNMALGPLVGGEAREISTLFSLGELGISYEALYQGLLLATVCTVLSELLVSDLLFPKMLILWRTVIMFFVVGGTAGFLSMKFGWFPSDNLMAWTTYIICFVVCALLSTFVVMKNRREDELMNEKLAEYKRKNQIL